MKQFWHFWHISRIWSGLYLLISVQQETVPDGAEPRGGQHGAPLPGTGRTGAAEQRDNAPHKHHRVVKGQEEAVGEESRQDLESNEQILARHSHVHSLLYALLQTASHDAPAAERLAALIVCALAGGLKRKKQRIRCVSGAQRGCRSSVSLFLKRQTLFFILSLIFAVRLWRQTHPPSCPPLPLSFAHNQKWIMAQI